MAVKAEDWQPDASPPTSFQQYNVLEDHRKTKKENVPLATFPSPYWDSTMKPQTIGTSKQARRRLLLLPRQLARSQDLEPLPLSWEESDGLVLVEEPRPSTASKRPASPSTI